MREKKDILTVAEAKQRLRDGASTVRPKQFLLNNFWPITLASFVIGMLAADSAKARERILDLAITTLKKFY